MEISLLAALITTGEKRIEIKFCRAKETAVITAFTGSGQMFAVLWGGGSGDCHLTI